MADEKQQTELPQEQPHHSTSTTTTTTTPQEFPLGPLAHLPGVAGVGGPGAAPKRTWPEVVGMSVEDAERKIKEDKPWVQFQVVPADSFVTMDFNTRRVRLYVDPEGKVSRAPRIG